LSIEVKSPLIRPEREVQ